jgi:hypothetical protein
VNILAFNGFFSSEIENQRKKGEQNQTNPGQQTVSGKAFIKLKI